MPSFKGRKRIELQSYSETVPYTFEFTVCSSSTANDGDIPYGHTVNVCLVTAWDSQGEDVSSEMIGTTSLASNISTVPLTYPATAGDGRYKLRFRIETTGGMKEEFDFDRVYAGDK